MILDMKKGWFEGLAFWGWNSAYKYLLGLIADNVRQDTLSPKVNSSRNP